MIDREAWARSTTAERRRRDVVRRLNRSAEATAPNLCSKGNLDARLSTRAGVDQRWPAKGIAQNLAVGPSSADRAK